MTSPSQTKRRLLLALLALLCILPSAAEGYAVLWGERHGFVGKALRDGLDFWAGGNLAAHGRATVLFDPAGYNRFLQNLYGHLPFHLWSYPPNDLLLATAFGRLAPWHAVLAFDALSLLLLIATLRLARQPWLLIAAVTLSPAACENFLEGQNAALLTALIGGGLLLLPRRPRLAGALIGFASVKPQLGLVLPLHLLRRAPVAFVTATISALALAAASVLWLGPGVWVGFWRVTRPAMSAVLLTGHPADFANGLISVFAAARPFGSAAACIAQGAVSLAAVAAATRTHRPAALLILSALACPYLHDYDLLGTTLAVALIIQDRLASRFRPGEPLLLFLAWFGPGLLPWAPRYAHAVPFILGLLLASALARATLAECDSKPDEQASSAGRSAIPARPASTVSG